MNNRYRKTLMRRVQQLGTTEHEEILRIIDSHGVHRTRNRNGVFVNLTTTPTEVLGRIKAFVDFCFDNKDQLDEYDKKLQQCKINHSYGALATSGSSPSCHDGVSDAQPSVTDTTANAEQNEASGCVEDAQDEDKTPDERTTDSHARAANQLKRLQEQMQLDAEASYRRKLCTKFNVAKKKFSKRRNRTDLIVTSSAAPTDVSGDILEFDAPVNGTFI